MTSRLEVGSAMRPAEPPHESFHSSGRPLSKRPSGNCSHKVRHRETGEDCQELCQPEQEGFSVLLPAMFRGGRLVSLVWK
jgi:hypothetical protein